MTLSCTSGWLTTCLPIQIVVATGVDEERRQLSVVMYMRGEDADLCVNQLLVERGHADSTGPG